MRGLRGTKLAACAALVFSGCLWPEPVSEDPPPVRVTPTIVSTSPTSNSYPLGSHLLTAGPASGGGCQVAPGITVSSSDAIDGISLPPDARFFLNEATANPLNDGTALPLGADGITRSIVLTPIAGTAGFYEVSSVPIMLSKNFGLLNPPPASNVLSVFVSDGFTGSAHETLPGFPPAALYYWQLDFTLCDPFTPTR